MNDLKSTLGKCMSLTADLVNAHMEIDKVYKHQCDDPELYHDIHNIQNRILAIANQNDIILHKNV